MLVNKLATHAKKKLVASLGKNTIPQNAYNKKTKRVSFAPESTQYAFWEPTADEDVLPENACEEAFMKNACEEGESIVATNMEDGPMNTSVLDAIIQMIQKTLEQKRYTRQRVVEHFEKQDTAIVLRLLTRIMLALTRARKYAFTKNSMCIQAEKWHPTLLFWIAALKKGSETNSS
jgi:hypothetical protein